METSGLIIMIMMMMTMLTTKTKIKTTMTKTTMKMKTPTTKTGTKTTKKRKTMKTINKAFFLSLRVEVFLFLLMLRKNNKYWLLVYAYTLFELKRYRI